MTVENVIEVWKSEAFQKEHGDSKEKIEKIISKWKMIEKGDTSKQRSKDNEQESLPSMANMNQDSAKEKYESQPVETDDIDCIKYKCDHCEYAKKSKNSVEKHMQEKH